MDEEIMFNECGRPCVLIVDLEYMGLLRKFVVPLRSNISSKTPGNQYFPLPPNGNTRDGNHHGVHYIKLFPIEKQYVDRYRINGGFYGMIATICQKMNQKLYLTAKSI